MDKPLPFNAVADGVYNALRREFGNDIEEVQRDETSAIFGFTVDGVPYSLGLNVTP